MSHTKDITFAKIRSWLSGEAQFLKLCHLVGFWDYNIYKKNVQSEKKIFLSFRSRQTLCYILKTIYTGVGTVVPSGLKA